MDKETEKNFLDSTKEIESVKATLMYLYQIFSVDRSIDEQIEEWVVLQNKESDPSKTVRKIIIEDLRRSLEILDVIL